MSIAVEIKKKTHLVIKYEFMDALNDEEREQLCNLCDKIFLKCGNHRNYAVCNSDEPYFNEVMRVILNGECEKIKNLNPGKYPDPNKLGPRRDQ